MTSLADLRPLILRLRVAATAAVAARRALAAAELEHAAARQELDDALVVACKEIR